MKFKITLAFVLCVLCMMRLRASSAFTYSVTNNTLNGVDVAFYESNAPGSYTFQTNQLLEASSVLVLTNAEFVSATNGIVLQFTNHNSFSGLGYLTKLTALPVPGCFVSELVTNYFTRIAMTGGNGAAPGVASSGGSESGSAPQTNSYSQGGSGSAPETNSYSGPGDTNAPSGVIPSSYVAAGENMQVSGKTLSAIVTNLSGEIDGTIDLYPVTNISMTVWCQISDSENPGETNTGQPYNLIYNIGQTIYDFGHGFYSGETFGWTNVPGLKYELFTNGVEYLYSGPADFNGNPFTENPTVTEQPLSVNGIPTGYSRYAFTLTGTSNEVFTLKQVTGDAMFLKDVNAGVGSNSFNLGFDSDGNYDDLNLRYDGVPRIKIAANGNLMLNLANEHNGLIITPSGAYFGNGLGGTCGAISTNGVFYLNTNCVSPPYVIGQGILWFSNDLSLWKTTQTLTNRISL